MSKALRRFLSDYRAQILREHVARFTMGQEQPALETDTRTYMRALHDVIVLDFEAMAVFYAPLKQDANAPAEIDPASEIIPHGVVADFVFDEEE